MKQLKKELLFVFFFITTTSLGQANFLVEGMNIKTGTIEKTYNFRYLSNDSIDLFFKDSTIEYCNPSKTIVKRTYYTGPSNPPSTEIQYFRTNGMDSISKHFSGDDLTMIYESKFDDLDRIKVYSLTDLSDSSNSFKWTYKYQDSIISTGKIVIQTIYVNETNGEKIFHSRVLNELDLNKKIISETTEHKMNDPDALVTSNVYDINNHLIEQGFENSDNQLEQQTSNCNKEIVTDLKVSNFNEMKNLIERLLLENSQFLISNDCVNFTSKYVSFDKQSSLSIVKREPYWCNGRTVTFTVIQTQ